MATIYDIMNHIKIYHVSIYLALYSMDMSFCLKYKLLTQHHNGMSINFYFLTVFQAIIV